MKLNKIIFAFLFVLAGVISAQQQGDYSKEPGYYDFGNLTSLKEGELTTEVYLEEPLLKMVANLAESKKEELGNALGGLKLVRVNEFKIPKNELANMESTIESMDNNLQSKSWDRIIKTNSKGNYTNVYIKKGTNDEFVGLTIVSLDKSFKTGENSEDSGKVTFVNIVGKIDLGTIGKLSEQLHVPGLDKAKKEK